MVAYIFQHFIHIHIINIITSLVRCHLKFYITLKNQFLFLRHYISCCIFYFILLLLLFSYSCPTFFPVALLCPPPTTPTVNPHTIVCAHESSIHVPWLAPSPSFPHYPPPPSPLVTVSLFFIFMSLVLKINKSFKNIL